MKNKLIRSFGYAFKGILFVVSTERNMKIHLGILLFVTAIGFFFHISSFEWIICLLCFGIVLGAESFNTAIEMIANEISPEYNKKWGRIKDISAGAVLLTVFFAVIIGGIIFIPKFYQWIETYAS